MSLPDLIAKHELAINGILHCGAHLAEEAPIYAELGVKNVTWIEANPAVERKIQRVLHRYPGQRLIQALLWEIDGETKTLNVTNYDGMSSSILAFGSHPEFSPDTVFVSELTMETRCIDSLAVEHDIRANFLNMDLQGVEGWVLRGASGFLHGVDYVMSEVNCKEVYEGCTQVDELDAVLEGFERVQTQWVGDQGWGDGLWVRRA